MMKIGSVSEADSAKRAIERIVRAWCDWRDSDARPGNPKGTEKKGPRKGGTRSTKR
jgi:hypothetical protein